MNGSKPSSPPNNGSEPLERRLDIVVTQGNATPPGKSFLLVVAGETAGKLFPLSKPELFIGRSANADIRINEKAVSHMHARLRLTELDCAINDMGSTNGTFVNNELIAGSVRLRAGDTICVGATTFTYLASGDTTSDQTIQLHGSPQQAPNFIDAVRLQPSLPPVYGHGHGHPAPVSVAPHSEDAMSFTDVLRKVQSAWTYTKRYGWLVLTCTLFGVGAGIAQTRLNPPPGSAWFEMTLMPQGKTNPVREGEGVQYFVSAESAFRSLPLIKKTLRELGASNVTDRMATEIQNELSFDKQGFQSQLWRGEFRTSTSERAVEFLNKHVQVYLETEIDKTLQVIRAETEFLEGQLTDAKKQLAQAEGQLLQFKDEHPEAIPKDALLPREGVKPYLDAHSSYQRQLSDTDAEIAKIQRDLQRGTSLLRGKVEKAKPYEDQLIAVKAQIAKAKASGLGDQHPEIKALNAQATRLQSLIDEAVRAEATETERQIDVESNAMRDKLAELQLRRQRLAAQLGVSAQKVEDAQVESLPQLEARYHDLSRNYESKKKKHETLGVDLEAKRLQLEMERASVRAHYDVITPPTAEAPKTSKTTIKRAGLGGFVGLILALVAAGFLEIRQRLMTRRSW
jgi:pSer/pThr/pTyr-binding forkhead associated (FHA) protein